jgi:hypothetical protein
VISSPPAVVAFAYATRNPALIDLRELRLGEFLEPPCARANQSPWFLGSQAALFVS